MKHWITKGIYILLSFLLLNGCSENDLMQQSIIGDNVYAVLDFGTSNNKKINIRTRTTYDLHYESMVRNVYAFVFANGEKIYGHYFDESNLNDSNNKEYWSVNNHISDDTNGQTTGTLHMCIPSVSGFAEIILIANIDLDFMNISKERLGLVRTKADLNKLIVSLNQEIPDRNAGYFMMTGSQNNVSISSEGVITIPNEKIILHRLDAKVEVNVRVNPNEESNNHRSYIGPGSRGSRKTGQKRLEARSMRTQDRSTRVVQGRIRTGECLHSYHGCDEGGLSRDTRQADI